MLNLILTTLRARHRDPEVVAALWSGNAAEGLRLGLARLNRDDAGDPEAVAVLGQLVGRMLVASGRDEEAEDHFQDQLRRYERLPRALARWLSSLDRGVLELSQQRMGRAAEHFNAVADDDTAPDELRIEALAGLATALQCLGERRRAGTTLDLARSLSMSMPVSVSVSAPPFPDVPRVDHACLLDALRVDFDATGHLRDAMSRSAVDVAGLRTESVPRPAGLCARIDAAQAALTGIAVVAQRLQLLETLVGTPAAAVTFAAGVRDALNRLRKVQLLACEESARVDAILACAAGGRCELAEELLAPLASDEVQVLRHRRSLELRLCLSRLYSARGRHADALHLYREYSDRSLYRLRKELPQLPYSRFLERAASTEPADAAELQLPLRYRKAYRYMVERLGDRQLSIRQVAAHIDVTERALQMTFRLHLGMTPAELIRRRRMDHIRSELLQCAGKESVLEVASRWGIPSRSTFAQNYRQQFGEAPSSTLRGMQ